MSEVREAHKLALRFQTNSRISRIGYIYLVAGLCSYYIVSMVLVTS